jgi:hypothetical protein
MPGIRRMAWIVPRRRPPLDRERLVERLPPVEYHRDAEEEQLFEQASLAQSLLLMVKVDQEAEYVLCREVAEHALGSLPDPPE